MKERIIFLLCATLCTTFTFANEVGIAAKVTKVIDGNTIEIITERNEFFKIMFKNVDSPELGQEYGEEARQFTEKLLLKKKVFVTMAGKDRWGNRLAIITLHNGKTADHELIKSGNAWHNVLKSTDKELEKLEGLSKENKVGLWTKENPTPPWIYRRQQSMKTAKTL